MQEGTYAPYTTAETAGPKGEERRDDVHLSPKWPRLECTIKAVVAPTDHPKHHNLRLFKPHNLPPRTSLGPL